MAAGAKRSCTDLGFAWTGSGTVGYAFATIGPGPEKDPV